jgi:hypothetical protein
VREVHPAWGRKYLEVGDRCIFSRGQKERLGHNTAVTVSDRQHIVGSHAGVSVPARGRRPINLICESRSQRPFKLRKHEGVPMLRSFMLNTKIQK